MCNFFIFAALLVLIEKSCGFELCGCGVGTFTCMCVPSGVFCPANYYCPIYPDYLLQSPLYQSILDSSSCVYGPNAVNITGSDTYQVVCPCTPGFYCPENTEQPIYCNQGYYCPPNTSVTEFVTGAPIGSAGLGAWGSERFLCPEGNFCPTGQIAPYPCVGLSECPAGTIKANKTKNWVIVGFLIGGIFVAFAIADFMERRERLLQDAALSVTQDTVAEDPSSDLGNPLQMYNGGFDMAERGGSAGGSVDKTKILPDGATRAGYDIVFKNMGFTLKNGTCIMEGVHGRFRAGRLCAVMGPSGAGKTTIINLVTGKVRPSRGQVFVNNEELSGLTKYQKLVGFVPQDDVMLRELTVRENIEFSARYRLPVDMTELEKSARIDSTIRELGIPHVQHSIIGDEFTRGVSGGQRKRVNIGIELVANPKVLFLDEPTSGLDSTTATSLCATLKKIARTKDMTIAAVIHQPSFTSFMEFDDLLLLGKGGRVVYEGPVESAPQYFESIGFPLPDTCNPADFYLDVTAGAVPRKAFPNFQWPELFDLWEKHRQEAERTGADAVRSSLTQAAFLQQDLAVRNLNESRYSPAYCCSVVVNFFLEIVYVMEDFVVGVCEDFTQYWGACGRIDPVRQTPSAISQFYYCLKRSLRQIFAGFGPFVLEMFLHLLCGAVISTAAGRLSFVGPLPSPICAITTQPLQGSCYGPQEAQYPQVANFMCFGILFAAIASAASTFGNEQVNYFRESAAGLQSIPYFLGKWIANIPRIGLAAVFFWFAFSIRYQQTGDATKLYLLTVLLYWFGFSLGYVVSQIVPIKFSALTGVLLSLIFSVALSGTNPNMDTVRTYSIGKQFLWAMSGSRWALEGFYINAIKYYQSVPPGTEFEGQPYENVVTGLSEVGYDINNFRLDMTGMFWDGIGWSIVALLIMLMSNRDKKR